MIDTESEPGSWARAIGHMAQVAGLTLPAAPARSTYTPLWTNGMRCPGCGQRNWFVGRDSAECACCTYSLPLSPEARRHG